MRERLNLLTDTDRPRSCGLLSLPASASAHQQCWPSNTVSCSSFMQALIKELVAKHLVFPGDREASFWKDQVQANSLPPLVNRSRRTMTTTLLPDLRRHLCSHIVGL